MNLISIIETKFVLTEGIKLKKWKMGKFIYIDFERGVNEKSVDNHLEKRRQDFLLSGFFEDGHGKTVDIELHEENYLEIKNKQRFIKFINFFYKSVIIHM